MIRCHAWRDCLAVAALLLVMGLSGCTTRDGPVSIPPIHAGAQATYQATGDPNLAISGVSWIQRAVDVDGDAAYTIRVAADDGIEALLSDGMWSQDVGIFRYHATPADGAEVLVYEQVIDRAGIGVSAHSLFDPNEPRTESIGTLGPDTFLAAWFSGRTIGAGTEERLVPADPRHGFFKQEEPFRWTSSVANDRVSLDLDLGSTPYAGGDNFQAVEVVFDAICPFPRNVNVERGDERSFRAQRTDCSNGSGETLFDPDFESSSWGPAKTWRKWDLESGPLDADEPVFDGFRLQDAMDAILASSLYEEACGTSECAPVALAASHTVRDMDLLEMRVEPTPVRQWRLEVWNGEDFEGIVADLDPKGNIAVHGARFLAARGIDEDLPPSLDQRRWILDPAIMIDTAQRLHGTDNVTVVWILLPGGEPQGYVEQFSAEGESAVVAVAGLSRGSADLTRDARGADPRPMALASNGGRLATLMGAEGSPWVTVS